jgi:hypothetical protein
MDEVDRAVPAQTQQRFVRADTKCTSSGSGIATPTTTRGDHYIVNTDRQTNCTSTPVYETIILNQAQRDVVYDQCRRRINSQKAASNMNQQTSAVLPTSQGRPTNSPPQQLQPFTDAEWKAKIDKNKQIQAEILRKKRAAEDVCLGMGLTINTQDFSKCVSKETRK